MNKRVHILETGGTIVSPKSDIGRTPTESINSILNQMGLDIKGINFSFSQPLGRRIDSSDMQPSDWILLSEAIYSKLGKYDGFIITHGTDTMAYTSSMLSYMLQNIKKPIILTGSQLGPDDPKTDAKDNLLDSVRVILDGNIKDICIVFNKKIVKGSRAKKMSSISLDAFASPNYPLLGEISNEGEILFENNFYLNDKTKKTSLDNLVNSNVLTLKLNPGLNPRFLDYILTKFDGILIEAYGLGGCPGENSNDNSLIPILMKYSSHKPILINTQCTNGGVNLNEYKVGKDILEKGVIPTSDMTTEASITKLMWALGHTKDIHKIKQIMTTNYCNEITI